MDDRERFQDPPAEYRILHIQHGFPEDAEQRRETLQALKRLGFGGLVTNVAFEDYLQSEERWQHFFDGLRQARELGMWLWLYDEQGYPSGLAGGLTLDGNPEYQAEGVAYHHVDGEQGELALDLPEGELLYAIICPLTYEGYCLPGTMVEVDSHQRQVRVNAPAGKWRLMAFVRQPLYEGTHAAVNVYHHRPYINIMDDRAVAKFIRLTHDAYERRLRESLGLSLSEVFAAVFTDEPSLMSNFLASEPQPAPVIPWCYDLAERYQERYHKPLLPTLPLLFEGQGAEQTQARFAFWDLVADLVADRYFGQIQRWCGAHNIRASGHSLLEESIQAHVYYYGDFFRSARHYHWPGIDQLSSRVSTSELPLQAKLLGSVAELLDADRVMSETSAHVQQVRGQAPVTDDEIRDVHNWLYLLGVNTSTSYYDWRSSSERWAQGDRERGHDWKALNTYIGRLGAALVGTRWDGNIGMLYPIESAWAHFIPQRFSFYDRREPAQVLAVDDAYRNVGNALILERLDPIILDAEAVQGASLEDGRLVAGTARLRCLVLPQMRHVITDTMLRVYEYWQAGGLVVAVGTAPRYVAETGQPGRVALWAREMFGSMGVVRESAGGGQACWVETADELTQLLTKWGLATVRVTPHDAPVVYTIRRRGKRRLAMLMNTSDQAHAVRAYLPLGDSELWNPDTGEMTPLPGAPSEGIELQFGPQRALFVVETASLDG